MPSFYVPKCPYCQLVQPSNFIEEDPETTGGFSFLNKPQLHSTRKSEYLRPGLKAMVHLSTFLSYIALKEHFNSFELLNKITELPIPVIMGE